MGAGPEDTCPLRAGQSRSMRRASVPHLTAPFPRERQADRKPRVRLLHQEVPSPPGTCGPLATDPRPLAHLDSDLTPARLPHCYHRPASLTEGAKAPRGPKDLKKQDNKAQLPRIWPPGTMSRRAPCHHGPGHCHRTPCLGSRVGSSLSPTPRGPPSSPPPLRPLALHTAPSVTCPEP